MVEFHFWPPNCSHHTHEVIPPSTHQGCRAVEHTQPISDLAAAVATHLLCFCSLRVCCFIPRHLAFNSTSSCSCWALLHLVAHLLRRSVASQAPTNTSGSTGSSSTASSRTNGSSMGGLVSKQPQLSTADEHRLARKCRSLSQVGEGVAGVWCASRRRQQQQQQHQQLKQSMQQQWAGVQRCWQQLQGAGGTGVEEPAADTSVCLHSFDTCAEAGAAGSSRCSSWLRGSSGVSRALLQLSCSRLKQARGCNWPCLPVSVTTCEPHLTPSTFPVCLSQSPPPSTGVCALPQGQPQRRSCLQQPAHLTRHVLRSR
jgi:hypothetical protein